MSFDSWSVVRITTHVSVKESCTQWPYFLDGWSGAWWGAEQRDDDTCYKCHLQQTSHSAASPIHNGQRSFGFCSGLISGYRIRRHTEWWRSLDRHLLVKQVCLVDDEEVLVFPRGFWTKPSNHLQNLAAKEIRRNVSMVFRNLIRGCMVLAKVWWSYTWKDS